MSRGQAASGVAGRCRQCPHGATLAFNCRRLLAQMAFLQCSQALQTFAAAGGQANPDLADPTAPFFPQHPRTCRVAVCRRSSLPAGSPTPIWPTL